MKSRNNLASATNAHILSSLRVIYTKYCEIKVHPGIPQQYLPNT